MNPHHDGPLAGPSPWLVRWAHLLHPHSRVLDVACGSGRHLHYLLSLGHHVTGVDLDTTAARAAVPEAELIEADLENQAWPLGNGLKTRQFDAVVVCNYLWRPLWPSLLASVADGGVLLYETFALGQEHFGRPRRPEFLLRPGELLELCQGLQVVAYECGIDSEPQRAIQRIAAVRDTSAASTRPTRSLK
jgi:SAM-dependent methyltransferase